MIRKVEIAGVNTAKLPVLSNEEQQELLVKIKMEITRQVKNLYKGTSTYGVPMIVR